MSSDILQQRAVRRGIAVLRRWRAISMCMWDKWLVAAPAAWLLRGLAGMNAVGSSRVDPAFWLGSSRLAPASWLFRGLQLER